MIAKNCSIEQLREALAVINADQYQGNIDFRYLEPIGRRFQFTITVKKTYEGTGKNKITLPGAKVARGRRISAACWHVHGDFFDALFQICPAAVIVSRTRIITKKAGNWQDWNAGSIIQPENVSRQCGCCRNIRTEKLLKAQELEMVGVKNG